MILVRALTTLSLLASVAHGKGKPATTTKTNVNNLGLCSAQKECVDFTIKKPDTSTCSPSEMCAIEVCLILDTTKEGCAKEGPISHLCAASNGNGCALYDDNGDALTGKGDSSDCNLTGEDASSAFDGKCEPSEEQTKIVMCQEGQPGDTLYWALKDGSVEDMASYNYTGDFTFDNYDNTCSPQIECTGDSGLECASPNNDMFQLTRVWKYTIPPKDGSTCDLCAPPPEAEPEEEEATASKGAAKNNLALCSAQKDCIDFTIKKSESSSCTLAGSCGIEVCMVLDTDKEGCAKEGPISHLCAASDSNGCAAYDANGNALTGKGDSSDCNLTGEDASAAFDGKCEPSSNKVVMCQEGEPGETLYWALKDSSVVDSTSYDYTGYFTFEKDAVTCSPLIECTGDAGLQCADPNNGMFDLTRVWKYTIPSSDGSTCDLCDAVTEDSEPDDESPVADSPFDVVTPSDPETPSLTDIPDVDGLENLDSETFMDEEMSLDSETIGELPPDSENIGEELPPTTPEDTPVEQPVTPTDPQTPNVDEPVVEEPATPVDPQTPAVDQPVEQPATPADPQTPNVDQPVEQPATPVDPQTPNVDPTEPADLGTPENPATPANPETPNVDKPVGQPATPANPQTPNVDTPDQEPATPANPQTPNVDPTEPADLGTPAETPNVDPPTPAQEPATPANPETPNVDDPVEQPATPADPQTPNVDPPTPAQEPATPADPQTPNVDPTVPADLGTPGNPATPADPETPVVDQPVEQPETPAEPETPTVDEPVVEEPETPPVDPQTPNVDPTVPADLGTPENPATPTEPETPTVDAPPTTPAEEPATPNVPDTPNENVDPTAVSDLATSDNPAAPATPATPGNPAAPAQPATPANPAGTPNVDPTQAADLGTPANDAGSQGDPHFKTWRNEHYEYHGQCDMVLTKDPNFADGLGLDVQIRTKLVRFWSYIKNAAIRIGNDVFEIEGASSEDAEPGDVTYWMNLEFKGPLRTIGGFPITIQSHNKAKKQVVHIDLSSKYPGSIIELQVWKEFVKVDFINPTAAAFGKTVGMLGDFYTGKTLARDGATELHDYYKLGNEWQVLPADNMLFHNTEKPQFPSTCIEPEDPRGARHRRRLDESSVTYEQAEKACANLTDALDRKDCVYDIIATQDMTMIGAY